MISAEDLGDGVDDGDVVDVDIPESLGLSWRPSSALFALLIEVLRDNGLHSIDAKLIRWGTFRKSSGKLFRLS